MKLNIKSAFSNFYMKHKGIITIIVSLILVVNFAIYVRNNFYKKSPADEIPSGIQIEDFAVYMETQKAVPSDIDGYSVYDKYAMGLQRQEGSDSDYDGLTDKEEIEVYGTDPLKASTAGDLYMDSYKVKNNMDLFKCYEYSEVEKYKYNECPEVSITAVVPTDFNTVISDCTYKYSNLSKYGLKSYVKGYEIYNCDGEISVDVGSFIKSSNDLEIYIAIGPFILDDYTEFKKCKYERDGNVLKLDYDFVNKEHYFIYISEKKKFSINGVIKDFYNPDDKEDFSNLSGDDQAEALIYGIPLLNFLGFPAHIDYIECVADDNTNAFLDDVIDYTDQKVLGGDKTYKHNLKVVNERTIEIKKGFFDKFLSACEYIPGDKNNSGWAILFYYSNYKAAYDDGVDRTNPYYKKVDTGFDKSIDELPFQNFESYIGENGNCVGISHLTAYLFNRKQMTSSGNYNCFIGDEVEKVNWNIGNDDDNATLLNPGLNDYKSRNFIDKNSESSNNFIGANLSEGEKEFVNMIGCFWQEGNDRIDINNYTKAAGEDTADVVYKARAAIDQGKVLDVYMSMRTGDGHAVNLYGYEQLDQNQLRFLVYDSNIPQDKRRGFKLREATCYLYIYFYKDPAGNDCFNYLYRPFENDFDYMSTSYHGFTDVHALVFMDENWNILN